MPWGGLGDALLATPALSSLKARYPQAVIYCLDDPFYLDLFRGNPIIQGFFPRDQLMADLDNDRLKRIFNNLSGDEVIFHPNYGSRRPSTRPDSGHAIKLICNMLGLEPLEYRVSVYLAGEDTAWANNTIAQLGGKVVSFHPKAVCSKNKEWYPERWAEVISWLKGKGFGVVQLGKAGEPAIAGAVSLLSQTTVRQALALVKCSWGFIGIDSVFNHAAHGFGKPSVVLFGASTPRIWGYAESVNIYKGLKCQPCIDLLVDKCPARYCMQRITAEEVIQAISAYL